MQSEPAPTLDAKHSGVNRVVLFCFVALLTLVYTAKHIEAESPTFRWDFQMFYMAAQMIRHGEAAKLYDFSTQAASQMRYVDPTRLVKSPDLPFVYPAATALLFLPLAWLPLTAAYAVWTACKVLLLVATLRLLQRNLAIRKATGRCSQRFSSRQFMSASSTANYRLYCCFSAPCVSC
jgi:multidrug transporter EmrE-like cation transporter